VLRKAIRGFGLAEVLVAIALFVFAFFSLLSVFTSSAHATKQAEERSCAVDLAERVLEDQRGLGFTGASSVNGTSNVTMQNNGSTAILTLVYAVTVTPVPAVSPTLKDILVNVSWTSDGLSHQTVLETAVAP
jgi:Tfp pilus assembly protein PilV